MEPVTTPPPARFTLGQKFAWLFFCAACIHLAVLQPYVTLISADRTNLFSGLACALTLLVALAFGRKGSSKATWPELGISFGLVALAGLSSVCSSVPWSSSMRAFVLIASGLGGFWCARWLLHDGSRQRAFVWLCMANLTMVIALGLLGYHDGGKVDQYLFSNPHQVINIIFLLSFSPLTLLAWRKPVTAFLGVLALVLCYVALFLAGLQAVDSGVLVPLGAVFIISLLRPSRSQSAFSFFMLLVLVTGVTVFFVSNLSTKAHQDPHYQAYRLESYPFSWHVATKHPFVGVGVRASREHLLEDYEVRNPALAKSQFSADVKELVTSENIFLTFMSGLGLPFAALYVIALVVLLTRLVRLVLRPPPDQVIPPFALLVALAAGVLHALNTDTLMIPQLNWYFHVLLGLIAKPVRVSATESLGWRRVATKAVGAAAALILGVFLGTHPFFSAERLPTANDVHEYLKKTPFISLLYYKEKESGRAAPQQQVAAIHKEAPDTGGLVINIPGYDGVSVNWAVMVVLDNSGSLAANATGWDPSRMPAALEFVANLATAMPPGSRMGVRYFSSGVAGKKLGRAIPFRTGRILLDWSDPPISGLRDSLDKIQFAEQNNLCAATSWSLQRDFLHLGKLAPRILLLTDGRHRECSLKEVIGAIEKGAFKEMVKLDVIGLGMPKAAQEAYSKLASDTHGAFLRVDSPNETHSTLSSYMGTLRTRKLEPLEVSGRGERHKVLPGTKITLAPGSYTVTLPEIQGIERSRRVFEGIQVKTGETTVFDVTSAPSTPDQAVRE